MNPVDALPRVPGLVLRRGHPVLSPDGSHLPGDEQAIPESAVRQALAEPLYQLDALGKPVSWHPRLQPLVDGLRVQQLAARNQALQHANAVDHWARADYGIRGQELRAAADFIRMQRVRGIQPLDDQALAQVVSEQGDPPEDGAALSRWALRLAQAAQAAVLNPRIEATEGGTPPSTMAAEEAVVRAANSLIALAQWLGVSFTVTHNPRRPFAMGNYDHVVEAWPARTRRKPVLTHGEG